jgi:prepilin-type processing-associated H-X9-DG protein/prepilin-type N-terminal cleavage/methylation domain-containing protein
MSKFRRAVTLIELLVVLAVMAVLFAILLPAVQSVRGQAARLSCANNLKQLSLAAHNYHDSQDRFPPGISLRAGSPTRPFAGWGVYLLPYIEQDSLAREADAAFVQSPLFTTSPHKRVRGQPISMYQCPSDGRVRVQATVGDSVVAFTSYAGVHGVDQLTRGGVLYPDSAVTLVHVSDGTSSTLVFGERPPNASLHFGWWYAGLGQGGDGSAEMLLGPRERTTYPNLDCPSAENYFRPGSFASRCDFLHFWSPHPGGANFAFADGSVHFLRYSANDILPALATRAGGEVVPGDF